jgi:hypothetical protein
MPHSKNYPGWGVGRTPNTPKFGLSSNNTAYVTSSNKDKNMCRSIKPLRLPDRPATEQETNEAALQYVRKVSGYRNPSRANQAAFDMAVDEIAIATSKLLQSLRERTITPV